MTILTGKAGSHRLTIGAGSDNIVGGAGDDQLPASSQTGIERSNRLNPDQHARPRPGLDK
jgi:hypothetical protein